MKISRLFAVASAAAFIAAASVAPAYGAPKADEKNKATLKKENQQLRTELDSLKAELEKYREELRRTDSVTNELLNYYENDVEDKTDTCAIVEYTTEVSDSLLHIWYAQKLVGEENMDMEATDTATFQSNVADSVYVEMITQMNSFITLPFNSIVKSHIIKYSETGTLPLPHTIAAQAM